MTDNNLNLLQRMRDAYNNASVSARAAVVTLACLTALEGCATSSSNQPVEPWESGPNLSIFASLGYRTHPDTEEFLSIVAGVYAGTMKVIKTDQGYTWAGNYSIVLDSRSARKALKDADTDGNKRVSYDEAYTLFRKVIETYAAPDSSKRPSVNGSLEGSVDDQAGSAGTVNKGEGYKSIKKKERGEEYWFDKEQREGENWFDQEQRKSEEWFDREQRKSEKWFEQQQRKGEEWFDKEQRKGEEWFKQQHQYNGQHGTNGSFVRYNLPLFKMPGNHGKRGR